MACDTCNCYFSFWAIFPFYPPPHPFLTAQKMKISKKKKTTPGDIILHKCTKNHDCTLYFPETWCMTDVIVTFHFGLFFPLLPLLQSEKLKFQKNEKHA